MKQLGSLDRVVANHGEALERLRMTIQQKDGTFVKKSAQEMTPEDEANVVMKGIEIGDRYFIIPNERFKPGDIVSLMVDGRMVQYEIAHMRQDQAEKLEKVYQSHLSQMANANSPELKEKKDDRKIVDEGLLARHLQPKRSLRDGRIETVEVKRSMAFAIRKGEQDKRSDEEAAAKKARDEKDELAWDRKKEAIKKEERLKTSAEEDSVTILQNPAQKNPGVKPSTMRVKTSVKNSIRKDRE